MAVSLRGVTKHYGALHAVDGVDLDIARGEIFGPSALQRRGQKHVVQNDVYLIPATSGDPGRRCYSSADAVSAARRHLGYLPENVVSATTLSGLKPCVFAKLAGALAQCQPAL